MVALTHKVGLLTRSILTAATSERLATIFTDLVRFFTEHALNEAATLDGVGTAALRQEITQALDQRHECVAPHLDKLSIAWILLFKLRQAEQLRTELVCGDLEELRQGLKCVIFLLHL